MSTALYVHIPFCEKKCPYCSFVVAVAQQHRADEYLACVLAEARRFRRAAVTSVYIGGGTPTVLTPAQLHRFLSGLRERFVIPSGAEVTAEANPDGLDGQKVAALKEGGVNRVSLGVQSFQAKALSFLGRTHGPAAAGQAVALLRGAGIGSISIDLMFAFPGQREKDLTDDLHKGVRLGVEHISLYGLTVEAPSRFHVRCVTGNDPEHDARLYRAACRILRDAGYAQYEVSNFARPGFESVHNRNYWTGGNYIGLGVGAHGHCDGRRTWNVDRLAEYIRRTRDGGEALAGEERLSPDRRLRECLVFGLRMNGGVDVNGLERRFGRRLEAAVRETLRAFAQNGWLREDGGRVVATDDGRLRLDELSVRLV